MPLAGGHSEVKEANESIQKLVDTVRPHVQEHLGTTFPVFEATLYTQQVVAGMVYHVKIQTNHHRHHNTNDDDNDNDQTAVHVRIFEPLPHTKEPTQLQAVAIVKHKDSLVPLSPNL